jgi:DNA-binding transcriptional LysR family regulator
MTLTAAGQALAGQTPGMLAGWDQVLRETKAVASRAALLRLPFPGQDDRRIEVLLTEPRWVALPVTHPLTTASRYYARPGITYRPVTGVSPSQVGVAWPPANDANPVVQDFVRCCLASKPAA